MVGLGELLGVGGNRRVRLGLRQADRAKVRARAPTLTGAGNANDCGSQAHGHKSGPDHDHKAANHLGIALLAACLYVGGGRHARLRVGDRGALAARRQVATRVNVRKPDKLFGSVTHGQVGVVGRTGAVATRGVAKLVG